MPVQSRLSLLVLAQPSVKKTATRIDVRRRRYALDLSIPGLQPDWAKVAPPKLKPSTALLIGDWNDVVIATSVEATVEKLISATCRYLRRSSL